MRQSPPGRLRSPTPLPTPVITVCPTQFLQAVQYAGAHVEPNAIPNTAAFPIIQNTLFVTDSELIAAQITPQQAVALLQSNMVATLKEYNLPPK